MLVLSRKQGESIMIGDSIRVTVIEDGSQVRIGIDAPKEVKVHRTEIWELIEKQKAAQSN